MALCKCDGAVQGIIVLFCKCAQIVKYPVGLKRENLT